MSLYTLYLHDDQISYYAKLLFYYWFVVVIGCHATTNVLWSLQAIKTSRVNFYSLALVSSNFHWIEKRNFSVDSDLLAHFGQIKHDNHRLSVFFFFLKKTFAPVAVPTPLLWVERARASDRFTEI